MEEILTFVDRTLVNSGCKDRIRSGVVLTGGAALIEGCVELGEQIFGVPTRIGYPANVKGLTDVVNNPKFSTAVGLLHFGADKVLARQISRVSLETEAKPETKIVSELTPSDEGPFKRLLRKMRSWFQDIS